MASFGSADVRVGADDEIVVAHGRYRGTDLTIEPDASSASYPLAMAAVAGGTVRVRGLHRTSRQGDAALRRPARRDGVRRRRRRRRASPCRATRRAAHRHRRRHGRRVGPRADAGGRRHRGVDADDDHRRRVHPGQGERPPRRPRHRARQARRARSPSSPTACASSRPGRCTAPSLATHHDHRLAMAFGVLGAVVPDIVVADPDVVSKSWPGFWAARDTSAHRRLP